MMRAFKLHYFHHQTIGPKSNVAVTVNAETVHCPSHTIQQSVSAGRKLHSHKNDQELLVLLMLKYLWEKNAQSLLTA